jgi:hypothetical protein
MGVLPFSVSQHAGTLRIEGTDAVSPHGDFKGACA